MTDSKGQFIKDLKLSDFALLDDQKAPAQVFSFQQQTNLPLRVGLLIDTSTSIRRRFEFEQQAAIEFILDTVHPRSDRAFVMGFDVAPDLKQDWTNDLDKLEGGINALRPGGGTALYDAVYTACRDKLLDSARGQEPTRKALVLVSDGNDNQSRVYLDEAIKMCQRAETIVYAIDTNTSPTREKGDDVLKKISDATGGITFTPERLEDISNGFARLATSFAASMRLRIARRLQGRWFVSAHLSVLQPAAVYGESEQRLLRADRRGDSPVTLDARLDSRGTGRMSRRAEFSRAKFLRFWAALTLFCNDKPSYSCQEPMAETHNIVGSSVERKEGVAKVLGRALYVDDISLPGMWYGATVRSSDRARAHPIGQLWPGHRLGRVRSRHGERYSRRELHRPPH